ncbi:MAG: hypothetical protein KDA89_25465, partial [Planctomycetaceae bacterium]|nr:hypothetical protein [Planctomycetaceae bacterium]
KDSEGYLYCVQLRNFLYRNGKGLSRFDVGNPFTLDNISLWISLNYRTIVMFSDSVYNRARMSPTLNFLCLKCGEKFNMSWDLIKKKTGCPYCSGYRVGKTNDLFSIPELASVLLEWDYKLNDKLPSDFTKGSEVKVWWKCSSCGKNWKSAIYSRVAGSGCPFCRSSIGEEKVFSWLNDNEKKLKKLGLLSYVRQKSFGDCKHINKLYFDFGLLFSNSKWIMIEYDGIFHYEDILGNPKNFKLSQKRDKIKNSYCENNNMELIRIPYWKIDDIDKILSDYFGI